jgi:hypothetical protein
VRGAGQLLAPPASLSATASIASSLLSICFGQVVCTVSSCASGQPMMWRHSAAACPDQIREYRFLAGAYLRTGALQEAGKAA